jgi:hypothetical protein
MVLIGQEREKLAQRIQKLQNFRVITCHSSTLHLVAIPEVTNGQWRLACAKQRGRSVR